MTQFDLLQELGPIHRRHPHIGDDRVILNAVQFFESRGSRIDELHLPLVTHPMQGSAQPIENQRFVVNKQQALSHGDVLCLGTSQGKVDEESGALPRLGLEPDLSVMLFDNYAVGEGQTLSCPFADFFCCKEWLENSGP